MKCTTSKAAPVSDTVAAGLAGLETAIALGANDGDRSIVSHKADPIVGLSAVVLLMASATYGYIVTGDCIDRKGGWNYVHNHAHALHEQEEEEFREERAKSPPPPGTGPRH